MRKNIEWLLEKINKKQIWHEIPVYCFTSDIDWASEDVLTNFFDIINPLDIKPTVFVTHFSRLIETNHQAGKIERGIHPNFLTNSSHGDSFREVIESCIKLAPEAYGFRSHRLFDVTDITHMLKNDYNYKYVSNLGTILQSNICPILHESGLIHFPIFFEDGTHLYNHLDLDYTKYHQFSSPGIKIISFHPMNFVFNSPTLSYMRKIKDTLTREEYNNITSQTILNLKNNDKGIGHTVIDIINFVKEKNYPIMSMNELYTTLTED